MERRQWMLQSRGLWTAFFLGGVPVLLLALILIVVTLGRMGLLDPHINHWDNFGAGPGEPMGGVLIGGWRLGSIDISNGAMVALAIGIASAIGLVWYRLLWSIGARKEIQSAPTTS